ncbi:MAG: hypothetical protein RRY23_00185 [Alistipes sp.]
MKAIGRKKTSGRHLTHDFARAWTLTPGEVSNGAYQVLYRLLKQQPTLVYIIEGVTMAMVTQTIDTKPSVLLHLAIDGIYKEYSISLTPEQKDKKWAEVKFVRDIGFVPAGAEVTIDGGNSKQN